jgi:hypothetical protein
MGGEKMTGAYLSIHLDQNGNLVGIDAPPDKKTVSDEVSPDGVFSPMDGLNQIKPILLLGRPNGSICCIIIGNQKICWPPCV